jgi:hypothetical protein
MSDTLIHSREKREPLTTDLFSVQIDYGKWSFRKQGARGDIHRSTSKEGIFEFAEGYMAGRTGTVVFLGADGEVEWEKSYATA